MFTLFDLLVVLPWSGLVGALIIGGKAGVRGVFLGLIVGTIPSVIFSLIIRATGNKLFSNLRLTGNRPTMAQMVSLWSFLVMSILLAIASGIIGEWLAEHTV